MKRFSAFFAVLLLTLVISACGNHATNTHSTGDNANAQKNTSQATASHSTSAQQNSSTAITREKALEIALEKAGVAKADIRDLEIDLDRERGETVWEVDFEHGKLEYSYDVHAQTGEIVKVEREKDN